jgi:hypothetical protein
MQQERYEKEKKRCGLNLIAPLDVLVLGTYLETFPLDVEVMEMNDKIGLLA